MFSLNSSSSSSLNLASTTSQNSGKKMRPFLAISLVTSTISCSMGFSPNIFMAANRSWRNIFRIIVGSQSLWLSLSLSFSPWCQSKPPWVQSRSSWIRWWRPPSPWWRECLGTRRGRGTPPLACCLALQLCSSQTSRKKRILKTWDEQYLMKPINGTVAIEFIHLDNCFLVITWNRYFRFINFILNIFL